MQVIEDIVNFLKTEYPYISYNYLVITDTGLTGFSKISGVTLDSYELKPFVEGGRSDVHILQDQNRNFNTMTLEKGAGKMDFWPILGPLKMLIIVCLSKNRAIKSVYFTVGAVLQKVTLSDLNASESGVLIRSLTIAYHSFSSLPLVGFIPEEASQAAIGAMDSLMGNRRTEAAPITKSSGAATAQKTETSGQAAQNTVNNNNVSDSQLNTADDNKSISERRENNKLIEDNEAEKRNTEMEQEKAEEALKENDVVFD